MNCQYLSSPRSLTFAALIGLALNGCDGSAGTQYVEPEGIDVPVPVALARATLDKDNLRATLSINGAEPVQMSISGNQAIYSGPKPSGEATYEITIQFVNSSGGTTTLMTGRVTSSGSRVAFSERNYQYTHSDDDGYTNIRELEVGTDPFNTNEFPADLDDNYEENDSNGTAYDVSGLQNVWLDQNLSTFYGVLTTSDSYDVFKIDFSDGAPADLTLEAICNSEEMLVGIGYVDASGDFIVDSEASKNTCDQNTNDPLTWYVSNPQDTVYYIVAFGRIGDDGNITPVDAFYSFRWN